MRLQDKLHVNRTGLALSPMLSASLLRAARKAQPSAKGSAAGIARVRIDEARASEPAGTVPPPASLRGTVTSFAKAMQGKKASVFIDKLGERLAFERSGTRLYDVLLSKYEAFGSWEGGPSGTELQEIREEERQHFLLLKRAMEALGADPTAVTPSANLHGVATEGLVAVLSDPRTDLEDGLEMILIAELVDNDCWENLIDLARAIGSPVLARSFEEALEQEREHLRRVRRWLSAALSQAATGRASLQLAEHAAKRADREAASARSNGQPRSRNGERKKNGQPRQAAERGRPRTTRGRRKPGATRRSRAGATSSRRRQTGHRKK